MNYRAVVRYNGRRYFGWQKQINEITIQGEIEKRLSTIFNEEIIIHGSGRTDAKVHAHGQVFNFKAPLFPVRKLKYALNRMLPPDIEILSLSKVAEYFHARFSAIGKTYEYLIYLGAKEPFLNEEVLFYPFPFDLEKFNKHALTFIGTHNFQNFTSKGEDEQNFVRTISKFSAKRRGKIVKVVVTGDGFMRGQIRVMIGTLLALNEGKVNENYIKDNLDKSKRYIIAYKVSGAGLYLNTVYY
mgnify:CR=1 FL=1